MRAFFSLGTAFRTQILVGLFALYSVAALAEPQIETIPGSEYSKIFSYTRELLVRPSVREFLVDMVKTSQLAEKHPRLVSQGLTETQLLYLLKQSPEFWPLIEDYIRQTPRYTADDTRSTTVLREKFRQKFHDFLSDPKIQARLGDLSDPSVPFTLKVKDGRPSYWGISIHVNHDIEVNRTKIPAEDLKSLWINEIRRAKRSIKINIYDFDLMDVAEELIKKQKSGVAVTIGIDAKVIETRPEVKTVYDALIAGGVDAVAVSSVGLNHQKIMIMDGIDVLISSGNLTQSCLGPEGDLKHLTPEQRPRTSIPNANHIIKMKSPGLAAAIDHELIKTLDPDFQLRGKKGYPVGGIYRVTDGKNEIQMAFAPNGATNNINESFIGEVIRRNRGTAYLAQFAFSSKKVSDALFEHASREYARGNVVAIQAVGDRPFAMAEWSRLMEMSGLMVHRSEFSGDRVYSSLIENRWRSLFKKDYSKFLEGIRVASANYGTQKLVIDGVEHEATAKLHHKILVVGDGSRAEMITGSFNFSEGAETNQEIILAIRDPKVTSVGRSIVKHLMKTSTRSVIEEATHRNRFTPFHDVNLMMPTQDQCADQLKPKLHSRLESYIRQSFTQEYQKLVFLGFREIQFATQLRG